MEAQYKKKVHSVDVLFDIQYFIAHLMYKLYISIFVYT